MTSWRRAASWAVQRRQPDALLLLLEALGFGVEFDEHLAGLHLLAHHQARRGDPAGHRRGDGMGGPVHFQPRALGHRVDGNAGQQEPGPPATQEQCGGEPSCQRAAEPVGG